MNTKYTVFLSSTYKDLKDERKRILDSITSLDYIPVGMEYFPAADDEQFNIIKKLIDDSDYYILIIGGRYGSINPKTKQSYTEMEYLYAVEKRIPVLVFAHENPEILPVEKRDQNQEQVIMLNKFKESAMNNRMAKLWSTSEDLVGAVMIALIRATKEVKRPGWTRGDNKDLVQLTKENDNLRREIEDLKGKHQLVLPPLDLEGKINLHFIEKHYFYTSETITKEFDKEYSLKDIFRIISLKLTSPITNDELSNAFESIKDGYYVPEKQVLEIRLKLITIDMLEIHNEQNKDKKTGKISYYEFTQLTPKGFIEMKRLNS